MALSLSPLILETAPAEPCSENLTVPIRTSLVIFFHLNPYREARSHGFGELDGSLLMFVPGWEI